MKKNPLPNHSFLPLLSANNPENNYILENVAMHMERMGAKILPPREYGETTPVYSLDNFSEAVTKQYAAMNQKVMFLYAGETAIKGLKNLPAKNSIAIVSDNKLEEILFKSNPLTRNGGQWKSWREDTLPYNLRIDYAVVTKDNMEGMNQKSYRDPHLGIVDHLPANEVIAKGDAVFVDKPILGVLLPKETKDFLADIKTQKNIAARIFEACSEKDFQIILIEDPDSKDHSVATGMVHAVGNLVENRIEIVTADEKPTAYRLPAILLQHCPGHKKAYILENGKELSSRHLVAPPESGKVIAYNIIQHYSK